MQRIRRSRDGYFFIPRDPRILVAARMVSRIEQVPIARVIESALEAAFSAYGACLTRNAQALRAEATEIPQAKARLQAAMEFLELREAKLPEMASTVAEAIARETPAS